MIWYFIFIVNNYSIYDDPASPARVTSWNRSGVLFFQCWQWRIVMWRLDNPSFLQTLITRLLSWREMHGRCICPGYCVLWTCFHYLLFRWLLFFVAMMPHIVKWCLDKQHHIISFLLGRETYSVSLGSSSFIGYRYTFVQLLYALFIDRVTRNKADIYLSPICTDTFSCHIFIFNWNISQAWWR